MNQKTAKSTENAWIIAFRHGQAAAIRNRWPALILWVFGLALVLGYFFVSPIHHGLEQVGEWKTRLGWIFSAISTAIFGGILPLLFTRFVQPGGNASPLSPSLLGSNAIFWAYKGVEVDFWYRFQAYLFGETPTAATIVAKTMADQLIYVPTLGLVNVVLFYLWRDYRYSLSRLLKGLGRQWYRRRILPVLISNWVVWIPAVVLIYCLPLALQLPVQNLVLCFWVLILAFFAESSAKSETANATVPTR